MSVFPTLHTMSDTPLPAEQKELDAAQPRGGRTFRTFDASCVPDTDWAAAAKSLTFLRLSPVEITAAIEAVHGSANAMSDPAQRLTLEDVTQRICVAAAATGLLREQAALYERLGVRIASTAADTAVTENAKLDGSKPLSEAAIKRIGEAARTHVDDYVAILDAEVASGETVLKALRRLHQTRLTTGDPPDDAPQHGERETTTKQIDLNAQHD